ncbi:MAG: ABC transporter substrate-binding protein [Candidatus Hydrogenedentes bacterium]|nr:ABC transporter substrate-binding protein [Candidatus Hydrogenedentota bacterium]
MHLRAMSMLGVAVLCVLCVITGCTPAEESSSPARNGIISMSPNITETLCALGQGDRIIAVSSYCDYPPEVEALPDVGGYIDPNLEKITMLNPELIILPGKHEKVADLARQNGFPVLHVHMDSLETIHDGITRLGEALDCPEEATALWNRIESELDAIRAAVEGRPRPKVLLINTRSSHDLNNLFTVGSKSFLSEMLEVAGGENLFGDDAVDYFEASKESVVVRAPDVIIECHAGEGLSEAELQQYLDDWNALPSLPAVESGRIYLFEESYALRPGPRIALIAAQFARWLHPDVEIHTP